MKDFMKEEDSSSLAPDESILIGEKETRVSFQLLQDIYYEITGKTEGISKIYDRDFQVTLQDLNQLDIKLEQACEQYNIQVRGCSVHVSYVNDSRETFSTFERFKIHDTSSLNPVEEIRLEYNFLIVLPSTKQAQSYTIEIGIASRITIIEQFRAALELEKEVGISAMVAIIMSNNGRVRIKYVDYLVAKNLLSVVDSWFKGLTVSRDPKSLKILRRFSKHLPTTVRYLLAGLAIYLILRILPVFVSKEMANLQSFAYFSIFAFVLIFLCSESGKFLGTRIGRALVHLRPLSYIRLNRGDEKKIGEAQQEYKKNATKAIAGGVLTITLSGIGSLVANWLGSDGFSFLAKFFTLG